MNFIRYTFSAVGMNLILACSLVAALAFAFGFAVGGQPLIAISIFSLWLLSFLICMLCSYRRWKKFKGYLNERMRWQRNSIAIDEEFHDYTKPSRNESLDQTKL